MQNIAFTVIVNGQPLNLTGATINIEFRFQNRLGPVSKLLSTSNGGITISNPTQGIFQMNQFTVDMMVGIHFYDCEIIIGENFKKTYFGGTLNVMQDTTNLQNG